MDQVDPHYVKSTRQSVVLGIYMDLHIHANHVFARFGIGDSTVKAQHLVRICITARGMGISNPESHWRSVWAWHGVYATPHEPHADTCFGCFLLAKVLGWDGCIPLATGRIKLWVTR